MVWQRRSSRSVRDQGEVVSDNVIEYIRDTLIPRMTSARAAAILMSTEENIRLSLASVRATRAAREAGIEAEVLAAADSLRKAAWGIVWDSTQVEAFRISCILWNLGLGLATMDLVGSGEYGIEDYLVLVEPWVAGYPEFPLPVREETHGS